MVLSQQKQNEKSKDVEKDRLEIAKNMAEYEKDKKLKKEKEEAKK